MVLVKGDTASGTLFKYSGTGGSPVVTPSTLITKDSSIESTEHDKRALGKFPIGDTFQLAKYELEYDTIRLEPYYKPVIGWKGGLFTNDVQLRNGPPSSGTSATQLKALMDKAYANGATAINLSNPVRPEVDILTAIADTVKDGIPHMVGHTVWRDQALTAKKAGDEYLNGSFGWLPLVSDVQKFINVVKNSHDLIAQYERGSGKRQRRGFVFPDSETPDVITTKPQGGITYPSDTSIFDLSPVVAQTRTVNRLWFSGAFRYYLAPSGLARYVDLASKLYGISLTPDKLWELAPWSWAADWFGNVGDVLANISYLGPDASVMEWGYMMCESVKETRISQTIKGFPLGQSFGHPGAAGRSFPLQMVERTSYKTRVKAQPYRFSATIAPLSAQQKATVIALGLSRFAK